MPVQIQDGIFKSNLLIAKYVLALLGEEKTRMQARNVLFTELWDRVVFSKKNHSALLELGRKLLLDWSLLIVHDRKGSVNHDIERGNQILAGTFSVSEHFSQ